VIAKEIAEALDADLDVLVAVKVGLPWRPAHTVGAVAERGPAVFDHDALAAAGAAGVTATTVTIGRAEIRDQQGRYRGDRPQTPLAGRTVVLADDGLSPGIVTRAAVRAVRAAGPATIVFAAPVCAAESADLLRGEADAVFHLHSPRVFPALGLWYRDAAPVTDHDATRLLAQIWGADTTTPAG
jgi:predicted phosphoribosyltransferase